MKIQDEDLYDRLERAEAEKERANQAIRKMAEEVNEKALRIHTLENTNSRLNRYIQDLNTKLEISEEQRRRSMNAAVQMANQTGNIKDGYEVS